MFEDDVDYRVGYGRPPRNTRFQPGRSGNPKRRPRGTKSLAAIFNKIINEKVRVKGPRGMQEITKFEAGLTQLANMAATGDKRAIRDIMHWRRNFPELQPPEMPHSIVIRFVDPKSGQLVDKLPPDNED